MVIEKSCSLVLKSQFQMLRKSSPISITCTSFKRIANAYPARLRFTCTLSPFTGSYTGFDFRPRKVKFTRATNGSKGHSVHNAELIFIVHQHLNLKKGLKNLVKVKKVKKTNQKWTNWEK